MRPRPFVFSGLFTAGLAVAMMVLVASTPAHVPVAWRIRGTAMLLGSLAVVATEALWRVRPWVWEATAALAVAHTVATLAWTLGMSGSDGLGLAFEYLFFSSVVVVPIVANVYHQAVNPSFPRPVRAPAAGAARP